jgi:hypothetical protein
MIGIQRIKSDNLTFLYYFDHNWSSKSHFDAILVGLKTRIPYISDDKRNTF